jgi:integrase
VTSLPPKSTASTGRFQNLLRDINLHFHDLRREAGSRWLDAGLPLHQVQRWLGHTNISQTSTYLAVTDTGADEAMAKFDRLRATVAKPTETEAGIDAGAAA